MSANKAPMSRTYVLASLNAVIAVAALVALQVFLPVTKPRFEVADRLMIAGAVYAGVSFLSVVASAFLVRRDVVRRVVYPALCGAAMIALLLNCAYTIEQWYRPAYSTFLVVIAGEAICIAAVMVSHLAILPGPRGGAHEFFHGRITPGRLSPLVGGTWAWLAVPTMGWLFIEGFSVCVLLSVVSHLMSLWRMRGGAGSGPTGADAEVGAVTERAREIGDASCDGQHPPNGL